MLFAMGNRNHRNKTPAEICDYVIERNRNRSLFYERLVKMIGICFRRDLRMILENPWAEQTHLKEAFLKRPDIVDADRMARGDYFTKPTAYWFWNCAPTHGSTMQRDKPKIDVMSLPKNPVAGMCSEARSMISPDYARNFIADFILGVPLTAGAYWQGELPLGLEAVT